jgi:hypothetical protein
MNSKQHAKIVAMASLALGLGLSACGKKEPVEPEAAAPASGAEAAAAPEGGEAAAAAEGAPAEGKDGQATGGESACGGASCGTAGKK